MRTSWEFGRTSAKWALDVNLPRFGRGTNWLGVPQGQRARQPTVSAQRLTNPREDDSVSACSAKREVHPNRSRGSQSRFSISLADDRRMGVKSSISLVLPHPHGP